ncbi:MAG: helix-turn-helix domain-containing protein [Candidatus Angelobacter sp.]
MKEQNSDRVHAVAGRRPSKHLTRSIGPSGSRSESSTENREEAPPEEREHLIDAKEAAAMLSCSPRTVKRMAEQRQIPAMTIGNRWRFGRRLLAHWCHERLSSNTAQPVSEEREG